jgi:hypothetical protein
VTAAVLFLGLGPGLLAGCQDEESRKASVRQELYKEVQPVKLSNCTFERYGETYDGGYLVCANLLAGTEAAYSYGISGYDEWGCDASRQLGVTTHEYDCFNTTKPDCPDGRTEFHAECVAAAPLTDGGRVFDTLEHQIARNGDKGRRLVVKMDVEGAEWDSLGTAPEAVLEQMGQLVVEFHDVVDPKFLATVRRLKQYFHVAHIHYNNWVCEEKTRPFPSFAYEVLFVSKKLGAVDAGGRVTLPNPLDSPNNPGEPDCQTAAP